MKAEAEHDFCRLVEDARLLIVAGKNELGKKKNLSLKLKPRNLSAVDNSNNSLEPN